MFTPSWESQSISFTVKQLQPSWACSLIDTDVEISWDYLTTPSSPVSPSLITLSDETPSLSLSVSPSQDIPIQFSSSSSRFSLRGASFCAIAYSGIPESDRGYETTQPPSRDSCQSALFIETPFSVPLRTRFHPRPKSARFLEVFFFTFWTALFWSCILTSHLHNPHLNRHLNPHPNPHPNPHLNRHLNHHHNHLHNHLHNPHHNLSHNARSADEASPAPPTAWDRRTVLTSRRTASTALATSPRAPTAGAPSTASSPSSTSTAPTAASAPRRRTSPSTVASPTSPWSVRAARRSRRPRDPSTSTRTARCDGCIAGSAASATHSVGMTTPVCGSFSRTPWTGSRACRSTSRCARTRP